ncbi:MAG TPA: hypothetical protein VG755_19630 [Nannocystaceae bacterium]|nr:hypothetical protein [Nannocystaceae bacterium]
MQRWIVVGSFALLACGEADPIAHADVADLCGRAGPVQILPLQREEVVGELWSSARYGDRYLYGIRTFDHPISNVEATRYSPQQRGYAEVAARIESIDRCGDDRRVIAEGADTILAPRSELEPWLARRSETGMLFWIDPEGRWPARALAETPWYGGAAVADNLVHVFREDEGDIARFTLVDDQPILDVVLDRVVDAQTFSFTDSVDTPAIVYALRDDGELVLLHLRTGRMESIAKGVAGFTTERDPRYVVWWPGDLDATLSAPITEAWLLDRERDRSIALAFEAGGELSFRMFGPVLATWRTAENPDLPGHSDVVQTRLTFLPELRSIIVDGKWESIGASAEGRRFTAAPPFEISLDHFLFESSDDGIRVVGGPLDRPFDGAFWTKECAEDDASAHAHPCDLIRTPFDTMEPEVYEQRAWSSIALPDDRWLVFAAKPPPPDAWRPDPRGTLWIVDGATGDEARLDREVSGGFPMLEPHTSPGGVWHTDEVVYQVRALSGDRTGLWRARFE